MLELWRLRRNVEEAWIRIDVHVIRRERREWLSDISDVGGYVLLDQPRVLPRGRAR